ncbi:MAG: hypothetical protein ACAI35_17465 [Candidatus Methylacidiphilales bacterium]|nr:hypothetical protein [Candidatus Methylacidiphilales bacterium]
MSITKQQLAEYQQEAAIQRGELRVEVRSWRGEVDSLIKGAPATAQPSWMRILDLAAPVVAAVPVKYITPWPQRLMLAFQIWQQAMRKKG